MNASNKPRQLDTIAQGRHLRLVKRDRWEFVQRTAASGVVIIVAMTPEGNVLFVEQYRAPVDARVIEFPAGLAGDLPGAEDEAMEEAAMRELLEETGYQAERIHRVFVGSSSAGLTDETTTFFLAEDLRRVAPGGGDETEAITLHEVPLSGVDGWLESAAERGCMVGARVYAGLYFLKRRLGSLDGG